MIKGIGFAFLVILFIVFVILKLLIKGTQKVIETGKTAYDAANSGDSFLDSFNKMREQNKISLPEAVVAMLSKVAKSDGQISQIEANMITGVINDMIDDIRKIVNVDNTLLSNYRNSLVNMSRIAKDDNNDITYYSKIFKNQPYEIKRVLITQLVYIASLDGYGHKQEYLITKVVNDINFPFHIFKQIIDLVSNVSISDYTNPYKVLGCLKTDSFELIKQKYRELVKKFHPDFIQSQNLDAAFVDFASEKMKIINSAYEQIKKERGI